MITCRDFHHIWLNEGFATYSEALYWERSGGEEAYFNDMNNNRYFGGGTIYVPDLTDVNRIFDGGLSYSKASWVLHMLRHVVGDSTFFEILKAYYDSQYRFGAATTEDFQALCESVSGMKLGWFFQEWIYGEYYPYYAYHWSAAKQDDNYRVSLTIEQIQDNTGLYTMPIDVKLFDRNNEEKVVAFDSLKTQIFEWTLDFAPVMVLLDEKGWILKKIIIPGDVTGDGIIDISDLVATANIILKTKRPSADQKRAADVDGDGAINVLDMVRMANIILLGRP
jgi:aminopeptidase N